MYSELSYVVTSLVKPKESLTVNSLRVRGSSIGIKNLDKIGRNYGKLLTTGLWILRLP